MPVLSTRTNLDPRETLVKLNKLYRQRIRFLRVEDTVYVSSNDVMSHSEISRNLGKDPSEIDDAGYLQLFASQKVIEVNGFSDTLGMLYIQLDERQKTYDIVKGLLSELYPGYVIDCVISED